MVRCARMKKLIIGVVVAIVAFGVYSLIVANRAIEIDETSPVAGTPPTPVRDGTRSTISDGEDPEAGDTGADATFGEAMAIARKTVMAKADAMPVKPEITATGDFRAYAHDVKGRALLIRDGAKSILRFEDFETINGPNLHIYLATDVRAKEFIDLGSIRATKGNVNYDVPAGIDTAKYRYVLVWCVPFRVLFSAAELR